MTAASSSPYPPQVLRDYALLADGERGALLGPRGEVAWMCAPRWQDDAVFSSLIGGPGLYAVSPAADRYVWGGSYEDGTLIWRSRWTCTDGVAECREALAYPGDPDTVVILRRIIATHGTARVRALLSVRPGFGEHSMSEVHREDGVWTATAGPLSLRWSGAEHAKHDEDDGWLAAQIEVEQGGHHDLVLEISRQALGGSPPDPSRLWDATQNAWRRAVPDLEVTIAPDDARQSYAVLLGMTSHTGAMVAAATMSLPERAREGRNYDYRYAWIRDQCYVGEAVAACGAHPLLDSAIRFVSGRLHEHGPDLKPAYTVTGGPVPDERHLDLPGYPGGSDVLGNWVNKQFQLDNFGEALLLFAAGARLDRLDVGDWNAVETCVAAIESRWTEPDAGIWELEPEHWTHSRLICAAGLRAAGSVAPAAQGAAWSALADRIVSDTAADSLHPSGRWQRSPSDERVDASLLLPALRGALPPGDPRSVATVEAVHAELGRKGYVYRFRHDGRPLADAEGAFTLCGFHLAMATHQQGEQTEAMRRFERNRAACGPPGLFTEEFDIEQRQLRGNLPQAFVHAVLLESTKRLADDPATPMH